MIKKIFIFTIITILLATSINIVFLHNNKSIIKYALADIIYKQKSTDLKIKEYINNKNYTMNNPKIIQNPYSISPLTALIIFQTEKDTSIEVYINDEKITTMESSKKHAIPIYGLQENYKNKIKLVTEDKTSKEFIIKTNDYKNNLNILKSDDINYNYFISSNKQNSSVYDSKGKLIWFIDGDYSGDIVFLKNNQFYISDYYEGSNGVDLNYASFLKMDYLGKIYTQTIGEYGYHHEMKLLKNNQAMLLGSKQLSPFLESYVYIIDLKTGETIDYLDFYELFNDISPKWVENLGSNFYLDINSFVYDESTNELIVSCGGLDAIINVNFKTQKIKWIFANPENLPKELEKYVLKSTNNEYPKWPSGITVNDKNEITFQNNNFEYESMQREKLSDYIDSYSSFETYEINEKLKTITKINVYSEGNYFSVLGGKLEYLNNKNKLLNYRWAVKEDAYNVNDVLLGNKDYLNGIVEELDKNNNIIFKAVTKEPIYRVYKMNFYNSLTSNFEPIQYTKIDGNSNKSKIVETNNIKKHLDNSSVCKFDFDVIINRMMITDKYTDEDEIDVLFVNGEKTFIYNYKLNGAKYSVYNVSKFGMPIYLEKGNYKVYIKKNNTYCNTFVTMVFD